MVYDELDMLQRLHHPNIVRFHDWFESKDKYYIVTQLATGGELFDRICDYGRFTEKDASQTIRQVLDAVNYLHERNVVHRGIQRTAPHFLTVTDILTDLKPENLLYLTTAQESPLVLADFGIAKMLDSDTEVLTSMAGSFGYAAPEVMLKQGHGKAVDMWSMGVITYTLLCGYSPFRSESLNDLIEECRSGRIVFHERYWKDVSKDAKDFILTLLQPDPTLRSTSEQALQHRWLKGETATDHNILPELKTYIARNRLKRGIEIIKLANRIEALKMQDEGDDIPGTTLDESEEKKAEEKPAADAKPSEGAAAPANKGRLSRLARGAIFREVVLAKVREMKQQEQQQQVEKEALEKIEKEKGR
ncbi:CAMK/CAMK1/CAMK1-CMK protein kinase, variant 2 [Trichophyton rubrum D6]|nr:CAMK/CAMK1/CAMK1-CMK protein kinase, variant 2 [Trichophyton rubrum CBS 118892]EZF24001.1 CAMK/CAMK1/CAMK1-CMK protein kinase, variant 2 [Trichophyton rubrum MR850]EZF43035.1 CAMK/CAMK1/CAMK1-CMK protein kinase, variant 2 [Trichophyton rubrum CBS 100081]EZF64299.1 CAMK/CAMK1/CAMK1-CMK protein kinase, variant 2 [Trichophyton rubrum CBS 289.86]EZF74922.1 CAMK/CAMK1/CAMK1-CMK protein kinase, variant 2 [Trichophyton soudanense CBS 452.61]EZF85598.1 CAMK/CAMK1/CAMK1-CMK protein kinase, variant 2